MVFKDEPVIVTLHAKYDEKIKSLQDHHKTEKQQHTAKFTEMQNERKQLANEMKDEQQNLKGLFKLLLDLGSANKLEFFLKHHLEEMKQSIDKYSFSSFSSKWRQDLLVDGGKFEYVFH